MYCLIIHSYLNFIPYLNFNSKNYNKNTKFNVKNYSNYNSIYRVNNTYMQKNYPNKYSNLLAFDTSKFTIYSPPITKEIKPIVKRGRIPNMIINKVTDYTELKNAFNYALWGYVIVSIFVRPPPPPPPPSPPMKPLLVSENIVPLWRKIHPDVILASQSIDVFIAIICSIMGCV